MSVIQTPRFPDSISVGSKFGPAYNTMVARNLGGQEASNSNWSYPLHEGDVSFGVQSQANLDDLLAFFHSVAGRHHRFRFKCWNDYTVTGSQGTRTVIDATHWQLCKTRTYGAISAQWPVRKPVSGTLTLTGGSGHTVDYTTGIVTKGTGTLTSWVGEFDFPVRFDTDQMLPQWLSFAVYDWSSIPIKEVRL